MGTNYEVQDEPTCDNPAHTPVLHIGKSSAGWKFGFQGYPDHEPPLISWAAWQAFLAGRTIIDEYGREMALEEFRPVVQDRHTPPGMGRPICRVDPTPKEIERGFGGHILTRQDAPAEYHDDEGYDFYDGEFS